MESNTTSVIHDQPVDAPRIPQSTEAGSCFLWDDTEKEHISTV